MKIFTRNLALLAALATVVNTNAQRFGPFAVVTAQAGPVTVTSTAAPVVVTLTVTEGASNSETKAVVLVSTSGSPSNAVSTAATIPISTASPSATASFSPSQTADSVVTSAVEPVVNIQSSITSPNPAPAAATGGGSNSNSLTISITNRYGSPLSIALGSNEGGVTPDNNPQPTSISSSVKYTFPLGWAGRISVGKQLGDSNSLIEASYSGYGFNAVDVSYVDGYSVPITCAADGSTVTGCNIELFNQGIQCDQPLDHEACPNSARFNDDGPAPDFFQACQGAAYTYPNDNTATDGAISGKLISCCIGTSCPKPPQQKSKKRDVIPHLRLHSKKHLNRARSHVHHLVQEAKMKR